MINKGRPFKILLHFAHYFERNIENSILFQQNLIAARTINNFIEGQEELTNAAVQHILDIIIDTETKEYHDGTGWFDYKNHILSFLKNNGFNVDQSVLFKEYRK